MRNINPFGLRLQPELKGKLEKAANENKRSLNAEITARLEASFQSSFTFADAIAEDEADRTKPKFSEADVKAAIDLAFSKLLSESAGLTATPKTKRPLRKTGRPLGMDQAEWEAKLREEQALLNTGVTHTPELNIPTSVKPERRLQRQPNKKDA